MKFAAIFRAAAGAAALAMCFLGSAPVHAQDQAQIVSACGTPNGPMPAGGVAPMSQDPTGKLCTSGAGGGGSAAPFQPNGNYASNASVTGTSSATALPTGAVDVIYNVGSLPLSVKLGNSGVVATATNDIIQPGGCLGFTVGANTYLGAILQSGSGTGSLVISAGSGGIPSGCGGGGGSSTPTVYLNIPGLPLSQSPGYFTTGTGTTAYNAGQMLCNSTTGSTCNTMISSNWWVLPLGTLHLTGGLLKVYDTVTTSWAATSQISVDLWANTPPTITASAGNGDRNTYAILTGSANRIASLNCTTALGVMGDGVSLDCYVVGGPKDINLGSANAKVYATFYTPTGSGTTASTEQLSMNLLGTY